VINAIKGRGTGSRRALCQYTKKEATKPVRTRAPCWMKRRRNRIWVAVAPETEGLVAIVNCVVRNWELEAVVMSLR